MADKGTFRCYVPKKFGDDRLKMIAQANKILEEYETNGLLITLRGLYYQFVARGFTGGENSDAKYNQVKSAVNDGRLAGLISWTAIEDRTRNLQGLEHYTNARQLMKAASANYRRDLWVSQPWRPEVWVEKDAQAGVVGRIAMKLRVDFFACRGYNSQSEQWEAGQRFARYMRKGQRPIVFHIGDHDPSGIDMTRDNRERLELFAGFPVTVVRLALNWDQIQTLNPPPNPTKMTDARANDYFAKFGHQSWEMDALDPMYIMRLIEDAVMKIRDPIAWDEELRREVDEKRALAETIEEHF